MSFIGESRRSRAEFLRRASAARRFRRIGFTSARGQHLNAQAGLTAARKDQFLRLNPRKQVIKKMDLAKAETCFELLPDIACKGAEKSFVEFADRISKEWTDENKRLLYGDDWFRGAVARVILFKTADGLVSNAPWYDGGYRAQIVAYTLARLAQLARDTADGGTIDWSRIWAAQSADDVLRQQMLIIAEVMANVLRSRRSQARTSANGQSSRPAGSVRWKVRCRW
jgi:hypothetical protein